MRLIDQRTAVLALSLLVITGCTKRETRPVQDNPRLTPAVAMRDVIFHSASLERDIPYRVILPKEVSANKRLPVVYLLHGGGGGFHDWSNYSDVGRFAEQGLILVMPEGNSSYYTNSSDRPQDRYEDYVIKDLITDVERRFPADAGRNSRAIVGVSMGGYGAIKVALKHPEMFTFAAGISPAIDVPTRPFSIKRIGQWRQHRSIFGPWGGKIQHENDPYVLAERADPRTAPYLFLSCGEQEGLLPANRRLARELDNRHFRFVFRTSPGGHNWNQWDLQLPECFKSLLQALGRA